MDEHREFLATKGIELPPLGDGMELNYEHLARVFLSPHDIPAPLVEKFHLIKQMSSKAAMDKILDTVRERKVPVEFAPDSSPTDIATQLLLKDRKTFQELHAARAVARFRGLTFFVGRRSLPDFKPPQDLSPLQDMLNDWYEEHQRGRSAKVIWRAHDSKYWFYVRHAEPLKREGCVAMQDYQSGSMIYHPECHDLVIFDPVAGELAVHGDCKDEPELFRRAFGLHLCGHEDFFPASRHKYTLNPLKTAQRAALACGGIEGLLDVTLVEVEYVTPGVNWARRRVKADDVFNIFESEGSGIPATAEVRQAKFAVLFRGAKKPRMVTVRPSNYAEVLRDDDAMIMDAFFKRQGFIVQENGKHEDGTRAVA
jgi:hypothetical protein